jgi:hypothetical protein
MGGRGRRIVNLRPIRTTQQDPASKKEKSKLEVAHAYKPTYSGGRDQEDRSSKPARTKSS